jgi:SAM-dependent methyltransferase
VSEVYVGLFKSAALAKYYLSLLPVSPDIYEGHEPLQRARMEYADERSSLGFHTMFGLNVEGKDVLDLGCGYGGRTVYYKEIGARSVTGLEIRDDMVRVANTFGQERGHPIRAIKGVAEDIPLPDNSVDIITSYDVFEHVESLPGALAECYRVLRPAGIVCAVFPPFYHPTGGSHLHGYVSLSPAPNLLFSCSALRRAIYAILEERKSSWRPHDRPTDALPSVNGTTVSKFMRMLEKVPFSRKKVHLDPLNSHRLSWLNGLVAFGTKISILREICTSRIVCELHK